MEDKIRVNAFAIDKILLGVRTAILIKSEFKPNAIIHLQSVSDIAPFARAKVLASLPVKVLPHKKAIHRQGAYEWVPFKKKTIEQIVKAKGFSGDKEFWTQKKKAFEGHLVYFELFNN